jgi:hypothetical protein
MLEKDLDYAPSQQTNGISKVNGDKVGTDERVENTRRRCLNALTVAARMPLKSSLSQKRSIFVKLLQLDHTIASKKSSPSLQKGERIDILIVVRRALIRYAGTVAKDVVEVSPSQSLLNF